MLMLPPTTICWHRNNRKFSITADELEETQFGLRVVIWDGYGNVPMDKAGFFPYSEVLNFEILVDPRDRFRNPLRFEANLEKHLNIKTTAYSRDRECSRLIKKTGKT